MNLKNIRIDTPSCSKVIHFNNAGAALIPDSVSNAITEHLTLEQELGGYEAALMAKEKSAAYYENFARLLNCQKNEIAFQESATHAWTKALSAVPLKPGDTIVTFSNEYASNYLGLLHYASTKKLNLRVIDLKEGVLDLNELRKALESSSVKLIALTMIASQRGEILPAKKVGELAQKHQCYYLLDACQAVGQFPLDVRKLQCDFLTGTGRKYLRGPRGTGFLYVNQEKIDEFIPSSIDLHSAAWLSADSYQLAESAIRFETWERNIAGQIGLATAVDYALNIGLDSIRQRIELLTKYFHKGANVLQEKLSILENPSTELSGIITFKRHGEEATQTQNRLRSLGINISISRSANTQLDNTMNGEQWIGDRCRASLHYYNTEEEINQFLAAL